MNAREMFEELGFMKVDNGKSKNGTKYLQVNNSLYPYDKEQKIGITFYYEVEMYVVEIHSNVNCDNLLIKKELHKAIHQQLIELGWLE